MMNEESGNTNGVLGTIGLSLSGGGYRAAGFHLGTLDYLNRTKLLSSLKIVSTVSGGTFTGAKYVLSHQKKESFENFYRGYYSFLKKTDLVKMALDNISRGKANVPSGRNDLIVSAAQAYADTFMKDENGDPIQFGTLLNSDLSPITEAIFNATEFKDGVAFRFQKSSTKGKIGNYYMDLTVDEAASIRMADIVAASSCFPGGFEPLAFPDDFVWPNDKIPASIRSKFPQPVALMDGGVYDNQGLESMLLADGREECDLGTIVISDVDQKSDRLYDMPEHKQPKGFGRLTLKWLYRLLMLTAVMCGLTVCVVGYQWYVHWGNFWNLFLYCIPFLLSLSTAGILFTIRNVFKKDILKQIPQLEHTAWNDIKHLNVGQLIEMLNLRATSLLCLTSQVFMKRIRSLVYGLVYRDETWKDKRISNLIYHLQTGSKFAKLPPEVCHPSQQLRTVADAAAEMPTTLWFDNTSQLNDLIACG